MTKVLVSKDVRFGSLTANADGSVDTSGVEGVNPDLRVRPFFAHGDTISIREFVMGALNNEMGLQAVDPELLAAAHGGPAMTTPAGMVLDGSLDKVESPPAAGPADDPDGDGVTNEIPTSLVDYFEFYLLNYFKPGTHEQTNETDRGRKVMQRIGCTTCHTASNLNQGNRAAPGFPQFGHGSIKLSALFNNPGDPE